MPGVPEPDQAWWGTTVIAVPHDAPPQFSVESRIGFDVEELASEEQIFKVRLASSDSHRSAASFLLKKMYEWRGYEASPLEDNPNRVTLVASVSDLHIGTISMGFDSPIGLLVDDLYKDQTDLMRAQGGLLVEFIKLAVDSNLKSKRVLAALIHIAVIYAHRLRGFTDLFIEVNPRHVKYYEKTFGFKQVGPRRLNPRVNAPALLMWISLEYFYGQIKKLGGKPHLAESEKTLYPYFFSEAEEEGIFRRMIELV